jgi:hypothetical protein
MNDVLVSAEKKNNIIYLFCKNTIINFDIKENDTFESILDDIKNENIIIENIGLLKIIVNIFLKPNNRILKLT